ncbi:MAG: hypothetical protein QMD71_05045 [bacterium]|nr:hypothetical protein [bacterium]
MEKIDEFPYWIKNYIVVKDLLFKGYKPNEIRELTGLNEENIKKYEFIVKSNYLIVDFDNKEGV